MKASSHTPLTTAYIAVMGQARKLAFKFSTSVEEVEDIISFRYSHMLEKWDLAGKDAKQCQVNLYLLTCNSLKDAVGKVKRTSDISEAYDIEAPEIASCHQKEAIKCIEGQPSAFDKLGRDKVIPAMYIAGYDYKDISEKLCIPLGTVKSRMHRAKNIR